jgi:hypothetical protein
MSVRTIRYDEPNVSTYTSVDIIDGKNKHVFNTGDFIKDWFDSTKFALTGGLGEHPMLMHSSSVDHFIMDGGKNKYDSAWLLIDKDGAELTYDYTDEGFELFVPKGTKPTWKELKEICQ